MRQRIGRRLLSIMLSVLMLVSLLPTAVFAEDLQKTTAGATEQVGGETGNTVKNSNENEGSTGGEEAKGESSTTYVAKVGDISMLLLKRLSLRRSLSMVSSPMRSTARPK